jgi:hypothetical protein
MNYKTLLITGTLAAVFLSGCAGSTAKPFDGLTGKNYKATEHKVDTNSFYSGDEDIQTPNGSFAYCWKGHCGKHGIWINGNAQFTKYDGDNIRPRYEKRVSTNIVADRNYQKEFAKRAFKALQIAKTKIVDEGKGFHGVDQQILLNRNGSSSNGYTGFCIKPKYEGSVNRDSDEAYFWDLKHCYSPILENGKINGWKEYDQSVCALYERRSEQELSASRLHNFVSGNKNDPKHFKFKDSVSCWNLGEYIPGKVNENIAAVTPVEFVNLITEFDKEFEKQLQK